MEYLPLITYITVAIFIFLASTAKVVDWSWDTKAPAWITFPVSFVVPLYVFVALAWIGYMIFAQ